MRKLAVVFGFALGLVACSGSTIEVGTTTTTSVETETADTGSSTTAASTVIEETVGLNPSDPLQVGVEGESGFTYDDFLGAAWNGFIHGMIETDLGEFATDEGRCLLALGTLTPTSIDDGAVTNGFQTPAISVLADGQQLQAEFGNCDRSPAEAAGYGWILEAEVTVGTTYPFFAEIFLPGNPSPTLETLVVGDPSSSQALYYAPTILTETP